MFGGKKYRHFSIYWTSALTLLGVFLLSIEPIFAVTAPAYAATVSSASVTFAPGQTKQVTLKFTNAGTQTWQSGVGKTAVYLYGKSSVFGHASWLKDDLPAVLAQTSVKPGQTGSATFWMKAPTVPGTYAEKFLLSYGSNAWIKGSTLTVQITVSGSAPAPTASPTIVPTVATAEASVNESTEWKAELIDRGGIEWQLDPGGQTTITVAFKNTGTKTWTSDGMSFVSLYTGKGSRKSLFKDGSWKNDLRVSPLKESSVKPGGIGHVTLTLRAPSVPGSYQESFQLAAEDTSWVTNGVVTFPIRVTAPAGYVAQADGSAGNSYRALLMLKSVKELLLSGNGRQSVTYGFKNVGTKPWNSVSLQIKEVTPALSGKLSSVRDDSWLSNTEAMRAQKTTKPGEIGFVGFTLKAPVKKGSYVARFRLVADDQAVEDGEIEIPITVTADGYMEPDPVPQVATGSDQPAISNSTLTVIPLSGDVASLPAEPIIRVGLFATTDDRMIVRAVSGAFSLQENGTVACRFQHGESVTVSYSRSSATMSASGPNCTKQTSGYFVAVHEDGLSPLELTDYYRPVSWLPGANDNKFRGKLELRYTPSSDLVWIINELPIEWYLKGIAETSNSSPQEYQRALLTAARTYAMYHVQRGTKHAKEFYTVDAKYDQVYRGYGAEARDPAVIEAVDATRGQIVTYDNKLAITPYYSRSDGRTRSWTEVWGGGPYPWLVSVQVPWDVGRVLWGHGVGLSATGAIGMARDGKTYDQILKHFYTGIELRLVYR